jgi:hypothetical protein
MSANPEFPVKATAPVKRPLINAQPVDEFGAVAEAENFADPLRQDKDLLYVPGWSEIRRQRDMEVAEYNAGTRLGQDVRALPVNVRWARRSDVKEGRPDPQKLASAQNNGYRAAGKEDIGKEWLKELPPGASFQADGTIRNAAGDLQLMVCSAQVAARNARRKAEDSRAQVEAAGTQVQGGLLEVGQSHRGSSPTVTKT